MTFYRWLFEDRRTGRIVIGQKPNALLLVVVAASIARLAAGRSARPVTAIRTVRDGSLLLWALDELFRGVNPFRRIGGLVAAASVPVRRVLR